MAQTMTPQIQAWIQQLRQNCPFEAGRVLEIGSKNVNGTVRQFFPDAKSYTGTDVESGDGVDLVLNNEQLALHFDIYDPFDTIIACEVLEHDMMFWETVRQLHMLLRVGGILIITTPTIGFPYHYPHPGDFWRFTEDAYRHIFFRDMDILNITHLDNDAGPKISLAGAARKKP
jgi:hypothetical protein